MPSSISSSSDRRADARGIRASVCLAAATVALCAGLELFFRCGVPRMSRIEHRFVREYAAVTSPRDEPGVASQWLVAGNSLLGAGVKFDVLQRELAPQVQANRLLVEDTAYFDWYYGLRRSFADGAKPDTVVLFLNPKQLVSQSARGDYFSYHLLLPRDVPRAISDLRLSNTEASTLAVANASAFFGLRSEFRKFALGKVLPQAPSLVGRMAQLRSRSATENLLYPACVDRLRALRQLVESRQAELIVVLPPAASADEVPAYDAASRAGAAAAVRVLVPIEPGALSLAYYSDGFHLSDRGASIFTRKLIESLQRTAHRSNASTYAASRP